MYYNNPPMPSKFNTKGSKIKTGLLLVAIGLILSVIPTFGSILTILILIGMIMIFSGSRDLSTSYRKITLFSLIFLLFVIIIEILAVIKVLNLILSLSSATSLNYSSLVKATDPFIFFITMAYILLGSALILISNPVLSGLARKATWLAYVLTYVIFVYEAYNQMSILDSMYYLPVTPNNVSVFTSAMSGIYGAEAAFMIIWAIIIFLAYFSARKRFPKITDYFIQNQQNPSQTSSAQFNQLPQTFQSQGVFQQNLQNQPQGNLPHIVCPSCGAQNSMDAVYCGKCGLRLKN